MPMIKKTNFFRIGKLEVFVNVLDANDNPPVFSQLRYTAKVASNATVGTEIATVVAKDADVGDNAKIAYRILSVGNHFLIIQNFSNPMRVLPSSRSTLLLGL